MALSKLKKHFAILNFTEANPPEDDSPMSVHIAIETDLDTDGLQQMATAIANIKEHADNDESLSGFEIPDGWEDEAWDDKILAVCAYMEKYTGRFKILVGDSTEVEVN